MEWYFIVLICLAAVVVLLFLFALFCYRVAFGSRCDKNPLLTYFTAEDFALDATPVALKSGKTRLNGFLYRKAEAPDRKKAVVFCHGLGAGHAAYMTEIAYLCRNGFTVLAVDNQGCGLSSGKSIGGMYSGVRTAKAAVDGLRGDPSFDGYEIFLFGHSWGAYSALCACAERKVDGVVALSAPVTPVKTISYGASQLISKPLAVLLCPFLYLVGLLKFGRKGNVNAAKAAKRGDTPVLLVHGDKDTVVPPGRSAYAYAEGEKITKFLAEGKSHNPYNSPSAQALMIELSEKLAKAGKMSAEEREYFAKFDFSAATEEDLPLMEMMTAFMDK